MKWHLSNEANGGPTIRDETGRIVCIMPMVNTAAEAIRRTAEADAIIKDHNIVEKLEKFVKSLEQDHA